MNVKTTTPFPTAALIDGEWIASPKTFPVFDPATGSKLADVPDLSADDARRAIDVAYKAFPAWAAKPGKGRAQILRRWFELIIAETEPLAQLMTAEQGKPQHEVRSPTAPHSSSGLRKKESAPTAIRSRRRSPRAAT